MCNRYHPTKREQIRLVFGREPLGLYKPIVGPLDLAPIVTRAGVFLAQWGMIPPGSDTRIPRTRNGKRMSTNNARIEGVATAWTFRRAWAAGRRCLIPAQQYEEPNWESGKNVWWKFERADGQSWALAGLYDEWTDPATGEVVPNFTMLTMNCDSHPLLARMHRPDAKLPADRQDKRSVIAIEPGDAQTWLTGSLEQAKHLLRLTPVELFRAGPAL